jgi:ubiquinone/menaquinone biosynthesis C-methylase UbiE
MSAPLQDVKGFWEDAACGERLYLQGGDKEAYARQAAIRYALEPMIPEFAEFDGHEGQRVLEIGVGLGADHQRWAEGGADLWGIDLTQRAIQRTSERFRLFGLRTRLLQANMEELPFPGNFFDVVYAWGVVMATPTPERAVAEILRVLKPGGQALMMLYHHHSLVGYMLWTRYALMRLRPWTSLREIYATYLESPGMKAYTTDQAKGLLSGFENIETSIYLTHADLLTSPAGQRHRGPLLGLARRLWPRWFFRHFMSGHGLFMTVKAAKPRPG